MIIKTITCHDVNNYGASLQAFALLKFLTDLGHDVEIIDYKPDYLTPFGYYPLTFVSGKYNKPFLRWIYILLKLPKRIPAVRRKKAYDRFNSSHFKLTPRYGTYQELHDSPPNADIYIAGSDQIWNTQFQNGKDPAFYLDFGEKTTRRISYAASFATNDIAIDAFDFVREKISHFDAISIREKASLHLLEELGHTSGVDVCDPVFLIDKDEWEYEATLSTLKPHSDYILVYLTDESPTIERIAVEIKAKTGWKIYAIGAYMCRWADKNFNTSGPEDFVRLISKASFIISNSFHATAFSLIFKKPFCVVNRKEHINIRMKSMLDNLGIGNRLVCKYSEDILLPIDYAEIDQVISDKVASSKEWLVSKIVEK